MSKESAPSIHLTILTISKELNLARPQECLSLFLRNVDLAMEDFKKQIQVYIEAELYKAIDERKELLMQINSDLQSIVWDRHLIKMLNGNYKIFVEFLDIFEKKEFFGIEKTLIKCFKKTDNKDYFEGILQSFQDIFDNTNSAKYTSRDIWFKMFGVNLFKEFSNYSYICWERVVVDLKQDKPLDFPCLNDILRTVETCENSLPVNKIEFLKKLKLID
jgi:hypothetical protein